MDEGTASVVEKQLASRYALFVESKGDWWALLGPVPTEHPAGIIAVPHDRAAVLDSEYKIGPITIRPGGKLLTEYLRSEPLTLDGVTWFETWPIFAEGAWPGALLAPGGRYSEIGKLSGQDANQRVVAMWLHRAACLLSISFGEAWQVRTAAIEMTLKKGRNPYSVRSKTAHGAKTHGIETVFGSMHMMIYNPPSAGQPGSILIDDEDATQVFMWSELPAIRTIAAELLLMALREEPRPT